MVVVVPPPGNPGAAITLAVITFPGRCWVTAKVWELCWISAQTDAKPTRPAKVSGARTSRPGERNRCRDGNRAS